MPIPNFYSWSEGFEDCLEIGCGCSVNRFLRFWNSINKQHPWESNPWVAVYEFKQIHNAVRGEE